MNDYDSLSDERLADLVSNGETAALDELFTRYYALIYSIGRRLVGDHGEAQDLVQEVFLTLFQTAREYNPAIANYRTWMVCITYHKAIDRRIHLTSRCYYQTLGLDGLVHEPSTSWESEVLRNIEVRDYLREAFTRLSEKQQVVIQCHIFEGKELREIAPLIGESLRNTRSYYQRGMNRLKEVIESLEKRRTYKEMQRACGPVPL